MSCMNTGVSRCCSNRTFRSSGELDVHLADVTGKNHIERAELQQYITNVHWELRTGHESIIERNTAGGFATGIIDDSQLC